MRGLCIVLGVVLGFSLFFTASVAVAGPELVVNGHFEAGDHFWRKRRNGWSVACNGESWSGGCSMAYRRSGYPYTPIRKQTIFVDRGTYRFSVCVKTKLEPTPYGKPFHGISVQMWSPAKRRAISDLGRQGGTQDWTCYSTTTHVAEDNTKCELRIYAHRQPYGEAWVDDVSVELK